SSRRAVPEAVILHGNLEETRHIRDQYVLVFVEVSRHSPSERKPIQKTIDRHRPLLDDAFRSFVSSYYVFDICWDLRNHGVVWCHRPRPTQAALIRHQDETISK